MNWFKNLFGSSDQIEVTVDGVNPQTENEYRFFNFVEHEPATFLKGWYKKTKQLGYAFKPQYVEAINQKIITGEFKNPHSFPEYFNSQFDYIAIDFETANNNRISACAVGLAFVKDNTFVHKDKHFILPPKGEKFLSSHSRLHGINEDDLEFALNFEELWNVELCKYFNNNLIIFHNASMDLSILKNLFNHYKIKSFNIEYIDTMKLAEITGNPKKLTELAELFNIDITNHHDPQADAEICADIFSELTAQYSDYKSLIRNLNSEQATKRTSTEASIQTQNENLDIIKQYSILKGEVHNLTIQGNAFVFTGELVEGRGACKDFIVKHGGLIKPGITSKVNYVILGSGYGWSKVQKIHELNSNKNCRIRILSDADFQCLKEKYTI
ncbi:MAG: exonuclease domain-containing protein [Cyclobacteriaceae bacterium]